MTRRIVAVAMTLLALGLAGVAVRAKDVGPQGLERLAFMAGRWEMSTHAIVEGEWQEVRAETLDIDRVLDGKFLRFTYVTDVYEREFAVEVTLSFDRGRSIYRMTLNQTMMGYMDVLEGDFDGGTLRMSNARTGTGYPVDQGLQLSRFDVRPGTENTFSIEVMFSDDGGKMWQNYNRLYFKRVQS